MGRAWGRGDARGGVVSSGAARLATDRSSKHRVGRFRTAGVVLPLAAQPPAEPTAAEVKALRDKFQAEREQALKAKFPADRYVDADADRGYDGAGFMVAAIKTANGNISTAVNGQGTIGLSQYHDGHGSSAISAPIGYGQTVDLNTPGFLSKYFRDEVQSTARTLYSS